MGVLPVLVGGFAVLFLAYIIPVSCAGSIKGRQAGHCVATLGQGEDC